MFVIAVLAGGFAILSKSAPVKEFDDTPRVGEILVRGIGVVHSER